MNPATGTFITMDEYAGSVFEPVSLHKYLYANANPVMYSDPSGYFSLSDVSASLAINNVLQNMGYGACMGAMLNGMLSSLLTSLRGGTSEEVQQAFLDGMASGFIFGGLFGGIGAYASVYWQARLLLAAVDFMGGYNDFRDAVKDFSEGHILAGIFDIIFGVQNAFSSANNARAARGMYGSWSAKQPPHNSISFDQEAANALKKANINGFTIKNKHLKTSTRRFSKFNVDTASEAKAIVLDALRNGTILGFTDNDGLVGDRGQHTYTATIDAGKVIGTKGQTGIKIVYDELGNVWTIHPVSVT